MGTGSIIFSFHNMIQWILLPREEDDRGGYQYVYINYLINSIFVAIGSSGCFRGHLIKNIEPGIDLSALKRVHLCGKSSVYLLLNRQRNCDSD